jgi:hypothetical protein
VGGHRHHHYNCTTYLHIAFDLNIALPVESEQRCRLESLELACVQRKCSGFAIGNVGNLRRNMMNAVKVLGHDHIFCIYKFGPLLRW